jgi:hypothetical protein
MAATEWKDNHFFVCYYVSRCLFLLVVLKVSMNTVEDMVLNSKWLKLTRHFYQIDSPSRFWQHFWHWPMSQWCVWYMTHNKQDQPVTSHQSVYKWSQTLYRWKGLPKNKTKIKFWEWRYRFHIFLHTAAYGENSTNTTTSWRQTKHLHFLDMTVLNSFLPWTACVTRMPHTDISLLRSLLQILIDNGVNQLMMAVFQSHRTTQ